MGFCACLSHVQHSAVKHLWGEKPITHWRPGRAGERPGASCECWPHQMGNVFVPPLISNPGYFFKSARLCSGCEMRHALVCSVCETVPPSNHYNRRTGVDNTVSPQAASQHPDREQPECWQHVQVSGPLLLLSPWDIHQQCIGHSFIFPDSHAWLVQI